MNKKNIVINILLLILGIVGLLTLIIGIRKITYVCLIIWSCIDLFKEFTKKKEKISIEDVVVRITLVLMIICLFVLFMVP